MSTELEHPPYSTSAAQRVGRPPLSEVPEERTQYTWAKEVPGFTGGTIGAYYTEETAKLVNIYCRGCALWFRAWEDAPRACPCCSRPPAAPVRVAIFHLGRLQRVEECPAAEARPFVRGLTHLLYSDENTTAYILPEDEARMRENEIADEVEKAVKEKTKKQGAL